MFKTGKDVVSISSVGFRKLQNEWKNAYQSSGGVLLKRCY